MERNEYVYRLKPFLLPGIAYLIVYPVAAWILCYLFYFPQSFFWIFLSLYGISFLAIFAIWLQAITTRINFNNNSIVIRSLFRRLVLEPKDIRKASFFWTKRNEEVVQLKTGGKIYYFSDLYFPFNELMTEMEEFITANDVRSNLSSHYGIY